MILLYQNIKILSGFLNRYTRARRRVGGRPKTDHRKVEQALKLYDSNAHSIAEITEMTGVTKATLYRALKSRKA
ncbi:helix-turn-helix domain-containing protein [Fodinisporobacter ferrooxydans]|uniref:Helix-turn-helix domain-containing protein n=1 Tax=Fodinisporobacter ferrooxydans TaxID=2901836 RepID=A0ABY4CHT1_9BACL|nr:helix-turn-helix domain-containing protein [Alicyclobacillaceae bacterium MYW30-H2]